MPNNPYKLPKFDFDLGDKEKRKKGLTPSKRAVLVQRYSNSRCSYCRKKFDYLNLDVHHLKERSKGGSNRLTNLTILCAGCHRALKHGYIDRAKLKPIMKPKGRRRPRKRKTRKKKQNDLLQIPRIRVAKL